MCAVVVQPLLQSNNSKTAFQHEQERITESNCYCVRFFWLLNWWFYSMIIIDLFVLNIDLLFFFFFSYFTFVSPFSLLPHLTVERKNVIIAHLAQSKTHAPFWMLNVKRKRTSLFFYLWHLLRMAWCQAFEKERSWMVVFSGLIHVASADIEVASESL